MRVDLAQLEPERVLVIMPTWLGDVVMATPTLRALRHRFPAASITLAFKGATHRLADAMPIPAPARDWVGARASTLRADLAVVLPGSFRTAWLALRTGTPRRLGYRRDGRGWLLTDRLDPPRSGRRFAPVPTVAYYLALARRLGATVEDRRVSLEVSPERDNEASQLLERAGVATPFVLLNPGAVRESKRWPAERFAQAAAAIHRETGVAAAVTGSPAERGVLDALLAAAASPIADLPAAGLKLEHLPAFARRASLVITNDTGPRHVAAAVGTPTVTLFGPTPPAWTRLEGAPPSRDLVAGDPDARAVSSKRDVPGREMHRIAVEDVVAAAVELLGSSSHAMPVASAVTP